MLTPLSIQSIRSHGRPPSPGGSIDQVTVSFPCGCPSAPYFTALVASSWKAIAKVCTVEERSRIPRGPARLTPSATPFIAASSDSINSSKVTRSCSVSRDNSPCTRDSASSRSPNRSRNSGRSPLALAVFSDSDRMTPIRLRVRCWSSRTSTNCRS